MLFDSFLDTFVKRFPVASLAYATLEHAFAPEALDELFRTTASQQYQRTILFSRLIELLTAVVTRRSPSVNSAYHSDPQRLGASLSSVYAKLNLTEPAIAEALLQHTSAKLMAVMQSWPTEAQPVSGLSLKVLDGNYFAGTEHRLKPLRGISAAALPGMALVVRDHATGLLTQLLGNLDAYVNERALADRFLKSVGENELYVADRNFCFGKLLTGIEDRKSFFIIRYHRQIQYTVLGSCHRVGATDTGEVFEQRVIVAERQFRLVTVLLHKPNSDGDKEIQILTNLSSRQARGVAVANMYRLRWRVETSFLEVTKSVQCELNTLGYPRAALLTFALALAACNAFRVVQKALEIVQSEQPKPIPISTYYMVNEMAAAWATLDLLSSKNIWTWVSKVSAIEFATWLLEQARKIDARRYKKAKRGPKKPVQKIKLGSRDTHRSTHRVLNGEKILPKAPRRP